jgi:hypothetical protein
LRSERPRSRRARRCATSASWPAFRRGASSDRSVVMLLEANKRTAPAKRGGECWTPGGKVRVLRDVSHAFRSVAIATPPSWLHRHHSVPDTDCSLRPGPPDAGGAKAYEPGRALAPAQRICEVSVRRDALPTWADRRRASSGVGRLRNRKDAIQSVSVGCTSCAERSHPHRQSRRVPS